VAEENGELSTPNAQRRIQNETTAQVWQRDLFAGA